jgi:hypothetical protein
MKVDVNGLYKKLQETFADVWTGSIKYEPDPDNNNCYNTILDFKNDDETIVLINDIVDVMKYMDGVKDAHVRLDAEKGNLQLVLSFPLQGNEGS